MFAFKRGSNPLICPVRGLEMYFDRDRHYVRDSLHSTAIGKIHQFSSCIITMFGLSNIQNVDVHGKMNKTL